MPFYVFLPPLFFLQLEVSAKGSVVWQLDRFGRTPAQVRRGAPCCPCPGSMGPACLVLVRLSLITGDTRYFHRKVVALGVLVITRSPASVLLLVVASVDRPCLNRLFHQVRQGGKLLTVGVGMEISPRLCGICLTTQICDCLQKEPSIMT